MEDIIHRASDDSIQLKLHYDRLASGIIEAIVETRDGGTHTWDYDYDGLDRLTDAVLSSGGTEEYNYHYSYDRNGNRLSKSVTVNEGTAVVSNYTYNALDQLTLTTEGTDSTEYVYDSIGRLVTEKVNSATTRNYTWSVDDHLLSVGLPQEAGSPVVSYTYDHEGRRVARWEDGVGKQYLQDNQNPTGYSQTLAESSGDGTAVEANYYYGDSFGPMAQAYNPESPEFDLQFLLGDHLSTTRGLTDSTGSYSGLLYSPFGDQIAGDGSLTNYNFTGQWKDAASGLQHHRARWLDTGTGRWNSTDPVFDFPGNFGNGYSYLGSTVVDSFDFSGMQGTLVETTSISASIGYLVGIGLMGGGFGALHAMFDRDETTTPVDGFVNGFFWAVMLTMLSIQFPVIAAIAFPILLALGIQGIIEAVESGNYELALVDLFAILSFFAASKAMPKSLSRQMETNWFKARTWLENGASRIMSRVVEFYARYRLPVFDGETTWGVFIPKGWKFWLIRIFRSGIENAEYHTPENVLAKHPYVKRMQYHVEGQAALHMRQNNISEGILFHNHPKGTCNICNGHVRNILRPGQYLEVRTVPDRIPTKYWYGDKTYDGRGPN